MVRLYRSLFLLVGLLLIGSGALPVRADEAARPEVRALWVDAFRNGVKTPAQIDKLIQDAVTGNINTLIVQVRRRGDAYFNISVEPRTEDPVLASGFDALQYLIDKAHAHKIEVHAWLNTLVAWNKSVPPVDPNHIWNLHGPKTADRANWVSYYRTYNKTEQKWSEEVYPSYFLDPGHPDAVDHTVNVYLNVVKNYNVDGIHLDYSRYAGKGWGYNSTSVARFNARYGKTGLPEPDDPEWAAWRRDQTANLVRKIYLNAIAVKPQIKVSSAVITWGDGPVREEDWEKTRAFAEVFQDWRGWLQEGIIDMVIPMNYFSEWSSTQQVWYDRWIEWEKNHPYERHIVIGPGIFTQYIDETLAQIRRAQAPSASGNNAAGVALYAYGASHPYSNDDYIDWGSSLGLPRQPHIYIPGTNDWLYRLLSQEGGYQDPVSDKFIPTRPVFPTRVDTPEMPWKTQAKNGYIMGTVRDSFGKTYDDLKMVLESLNPNPEAPKLRRVIYTDGNGWFGMAGLPPGHYRFVVQDQRFAGEWMREVIIEVGRVAEVGS